MLENEDISSINFFYYYSNKRTVTSHCQRLRTEYVGVYAASTFDYDKASEAAEILETQIELSISARNLRDFAFCYKMCVTYTRPLDGSGSWSEYHRTEIFSGTNSPEFAKKVLVPHLFHEKRELRFQFFSTGKRFTNENTTDLGKLYSGGYATCKLAELMSVRKLELPLRFDDGKKRNIGFVVIRAEKLVNKCDELELELKGEDLNIHQRWFSLNDPHFEIFKEVEPFDIKEDQSEPAKEYTLVYKSESRFTTNDLKASASWNSFDIFTNSLCNGVRRRKLKFVCKNNKDVIGEFETSLEEMQNEKAKFALINAAGKTNGKISIQDFKLTPTFTFAEFLKSGLRIRCYVAIDFTTIEKPHEYKYTEAITLAVTALEDYIWDNKFAVSGFGARNKDGSFIDQFSLNSSAEGVRGVLRAYREKLASVNRGANADVGLIIKMVKEKLGQLRTSTEYSILLVIMHGEVAETSTFVAALKSINYKPLAVIILGMDDSNLVKMKELHNKKVLDTQYFGEKANFISFNQFTSYDTDDAKSYFSAELLAKLPGQVVKFMLANELKPKK